MKLYFQFFAVWLENAYSPRKIGVFGDSPPQIGNNINETLKRHTLVRVRVV